jgi:hypothetical protein
MGNYCPECGSSVAQADPEVPVIDVTEEAPVTVAEVEIAKIGADRDVAIAKINAGIAVDETIHEAEVHAARAEGEADGMAEGITAVNPEPDTEAAPVIVEPEPEPEPSVEPPPVESHHREEKRGGASWF